MPDVQLSRRALVLGALALALALDVREPAFRDAGTAYEAPTPRGAATQAVQHSAARRRRGRRGSARRASTGSRRARGSPTRSRARAARRGKADLALVNLAAPLADGTQIVVPARVPARAAAAGRSPAAPAGPVHLNTATLEELDALPGVGPVTAQKILDYRQQHGAFANVDELDAIPGIGPARLDQLRDLVAP